MLLNVELQLIITFYDRFGVRFGVFVCFDMLFPDPPMTLLQLGISHFIFPVSCSRAYFRAS